MRVLLKYVKVLKNPKYEVCTSIQKRHQNIQRVPGKSVRNGLITNAYKCRVPALLSTIGKAIHSIHAKSQTCNKKHTKTMCAGAVEIAEYAGFCENAKNKKKG